MISLKRTKKMQSIKIIGVFLVSFLILSTLTIVPQVNGAPLMEKINQKEEIEAIMVTIEESTNNEITSDTSILTNLLVTLLSNILGDTINPELFTNLINGNSDASMLSQIIELIRGMLQSTNGLEGTPGSSDNTILNIIISIINSILALTMTLLKIVGSAAISLISGILRVIGAIITMILLFLVGTQTVLTLGAVLMLFLGLMSKYGIKALSIIGAPIFALIAAQASISIGTIAGGISQVFFSVLAILLLFALPLGIGAVIFLLLGGGDDDGGDGLDLSNIDLNFDRTGLLYMILSNISSSLKNSTK